jgi:hypothetical protein
MVDDGDQLVTENAFNVVAPAWVTFRSVRRWLWSWSFNRAAVLSMRLVVQCAVFTYTYSLPCPELERPAGCWTGDWMRALHDSEAAPVVSVSPQEAGHHRSNPKMRPLVSDSSRLDPATDFPEDLASIDRDDLDILNSRNHRSRDEQYIRNGEVDAETEGQHHELREELDRRQTIRETPVMADDVAADADSEARKA